MSSIPQAAAERFTRLVQSGIRRLRRQEPIKITDGKPTPAEARLARLSTWARDSTCTTDFIPELQARIRALDDVIDDQFRDHAALIEAIGERKALRKLEALFTKKLIARETSPS